MKQLNWWKSIASFLVVLFTMPLGHALMMIMDKTMTPEAVHYSAFFMGLAGLIMVVIGVFVKGDTKQTLWGLFGGLLFWTGWIEFLFQYYATRWGTQPEMENGMQGEPATPTGAVCARRELHGRKPVIGAT